MAEAEIVPATIAHVRTVPLERAWRRRVERAGFNPRRHALATFGFSVFSRAALIAGRPVAVWGVTPPVPAVSPANPWFVGEPSRAILRMAWRGVAEALERYDEAIIFAFDDDERSVRMALHFGFRDPDVQAGSIKSTAWRIMKDSRFKARVGDAELVALLRRRDWSAADARC